MKSLTNINTEQKAICGTVVTTQWALNQADSYVSIYSKLTTSGFGLNLWQAAISIVSGLCALKRVLHS